MRDPLATPDFCQTNSRPRPPIRLPAPPEAIRCEILLPLTTRHSIVPFPP